MKKKYICASLFFILLSSTIISSTDKITTKNKFENKEISNQKLLFGEDEYEDDLDHLTGDAVNVGIIPKEIKPASTLEIILTRASIVFLLKPYIYIVTQYRILKEWLAEKINCLCYFKKEESKESENRAD